MNESEKKELEKVIKHMQESREKFNIIADEYQDLLNKLRIEEEEAEHGVRFIPSPSFAPGRVIDRIVIHITQGSFTGAINWLKNPNSKVSAHFVISGKGELVQMVNLKDIAWHATPYNTRSIGIEHEGKYVIEQGCISTSFTKEQYAKSAKLVKELANKFGIPLDRKHIIGHNEVPGATKSCPSPLWDWDYYMELLGE